jgi:hypothetical protein
MARIVYTERLYAVDIYQVADAARHVLSLFHRS